ncbi:GntR family transcriptional regulator [Streptomyces lunaelactis]|uniref:GntR family transcriptional regulator n=1 Tax=Streptomyces lunaelactis TaxID=1535768 RepID=UPI0015854F73|nr:GntR family transcriptional regulator [Streptomyces lunaelactis]NUK11168.1 GntR family transcriptional regulator [Streptomyces lunaelactis]NUK74669.1 GntR family transcriptional regulator [Streptomyces lunaelactis]NUL13220.1 GntR family transcriptional regulator [Streptomyces lunaelactis]NUL26234.1 GntR family transcriptional regulator [Streptomyces lunaelactis]
MNENRAKLGFREIAATLRADIMNGRYPTASVLPPEPELAERYGASRSLVNRAMSVLAAEGLVRPRQGRGTMVTWLPPMVHSAARYSRSARERGDAKGAFDSEVLALGLEPKHEITVEHAEPPAEIADALGLPRGEVNCLVRRRRLLASGIPVRLNASWFPLSIAKETVLEEAAPVIKGGVKSALAELGYQQTQAQERIVPSRLPTESEARALEISRDRTITDIVHTGHTADGRTVEVTTTLAPAHYLVIEHTFPLS